MGKEYGIYLEQRYIHSTAKVVARLLTRADAEALHYKDGFRGVDGSDRFTTYVDGFDTESAARQYVKDLNNGILLEGDDLKNWDTISAERGILNLTLTERERDLILAALDSLTHAEDGEELTHQCKALTDRLRKVSSPEE